MIIDIDMLLTYGATYKSVKAGEIIFQEGGVAIFYYQLVTGSVRWVTINEEGREFIQLLAQQGESFGELPLFDDGAYAASAIAEQDSMLLRLHKSNFLQMLKDHPQVLFEFTRLLSERMRFKFLTIQELAYYNPEHQVNSLLNYFKQHHRHTCPNCNQIKLTRQQIANMTGLRVETVIRVMRHLHDKGELHIDKGKAYSIA